MRSAKSWHREAEISAPGRGGNQARLAEIPAINGVITPINEQKNMVKHGNWGYFGPNKPGIEWGYTLPETNSKST